MVLPEFIFSGLEGPIFKIISEDNNTTKEIKMNNEGNLTIEDSELEHNTTKYEITNIDEESTTSSNYVDLPNLALDNPKPKAGSYLVVFSCVAVCSNANGYAYIIINDEGGGDVTHSERRMKGNKESSLSTVAVITVDGSEYIKVKYRRNSQGSAKITNANLVAVRLGD